MNRNDFCETLRTKFGKRYYSTILYPTLPLSSRDTYILTESNDTLTDIANKFWNDVNLWWVIAVMNPEVKKDSLHLDTNMQLRIPDLEEFMTEFKKINS